MRSMMSGLVWSGVAEVLNLIEKHSEKYKPPKQTTTKLERLSGWTSLIGGAFVVAGEVVRQVVDLEVSSWSFAYLALSFVGLVMFAAGAIVSIVELVRTTRRTFAEHLSQVIQALDREWALVAALEGFDNATLELACERLKLESTKVASRLSLIGGGDGLRTSLVGVAMIAVALVSEYESVVHGWTMKSLALFGVALLLGLNRTVCALWGVTSRLLQ